MKKKCKVEDSILILELTGSYEQLTNLVELPVMIGMESVDDPNWNPFENFKYEIHDRCPIHGQASTPECKAKSKPPCITTYKDDSSFCQCDRCDKK